MQGLLSYVKIPPQAKYLVVYALGPSDVSNHPAIKRWSSHLPFTHHPKKPGINYDFASLSTTERNGRRSAKALAKGHSLDDGYAVQMAALSPRDLNASRDLGGENAHQSNSGRLVQLEPDRQAAAENYRTRLRNDYQETRNAREGVGDAYKDLEIDIFNGCVSLNSERGVFGVNICEQLTPEENLVNNGFNESGWAAAKRTNADPTSNQLSIPVGDFSLLGAILRKYLGAGFETHSIKKLSLHTGHGLCWPVREYKKSFPYHYDAFKQIGYNDNREAAALWFGTELLIKPILEQKSDNYLNLNWASGGVIDVVACSVAKDEDFLRELQRVFSGGKATIYGATIPIRTFGGSVNDSAMESQKAGVKGYVELGPTY